MLSGADLRNASFRGANLDTVDLRYADLTGADFTGATSLRFLDLRGAIVNDVAGLSKAEIRSATSAHGKTDGPTRPGHVLCVAPVR